MNHSHLASTGVWVVGLAMAISADAVTYIPTLLHPTGFDRSEANGIAGGSQVGAGAGPTTGGQTHALLWNSTAASVVDLNPVGFDESRAFGVSDGSQVGDGAGPTTGGQTHALHGTAPRRAWSICTPLALTIRSQPTSRAEGKSGVALRPASLTTRCCGAAQRPASSICILPGLTCRPRTAFRTVARSGSAFPSGSTRYWNGTAASVVDLHPAGFGHSEAYGVAGGSQVGIGSSFGADQHALLWNGTAASVVDLHPAGFTESRASAVAGGSQVGYGADRRPVA